MNSARSILLGLLISVIPLLAFGQSTPEGFRDLRWGATREEVSRAFPRATCKTGRSTSNDWTCLIQDDKVNEVRVNIVIGGYDSGRVVGMWRFSLYFKSHDARHIVDAFVSRYGSWSTVRETEFQTKAGGRFPNTEWVWEFPNVMLRVKQHELEHGTGQAIVALRAGLEEVLERTEQRNPGAGKGL